MVSLVGIVVNLVFVIFFELNIFYLALQRTQFFLQKNIEKMKTDYLMKAYSEIIESQLSHQIILENSKGINLNFTKEKSFTYKIPVIEIFEGLLIKKYKKGILTKRTIEVGAKFKKEMINMNIIDEKLENIRKWKQIVFLIDYIYNELELVRHKINSIYMTSSYITKFLKFLEWAYISDIKRIDKYQSDSENSLNFIYKKIQYMKNHIKDVELLLNFEIRNNRFQLL